MNPKTMQPLSAKHPDREWGWCQDLSITSCKNHKWHCTSAAIGWWVVYHCSNDGWWMFWWNFRSNYWPGAHINLWHYTYSCDPNITTGLPHQNQNNLFLPNWFTGLFIQDVKLVNKQYMLNIHWLSIDPYTIQSLITFNVIQSIYFRIIFTAHSNFLSI